jgi:ElaB/YqjD/DUF883 family membrane-anchored ribosome-binding protein
MLEARLSERKDSMSSGPIEQKPRDRREDKDFEDWKYGQKVADAATTAKDYVSDKMTPVVDKIKDLQNTDIKEVANQAKDYARQNPGQAILISAAAGLVLGLLIRGRRKTE